MQEIHALQCNDNLVSFLWKIIDFKILLFWCKFVSRGIFSHWLADRVMNYSLATGIGDDACTLGKTDLIIVERGSMIHL